MIHLRELKLLCAFSQGGARHRAAKPNSGTRKQLSGRPNCRGLCRIPRTRPQIVFAEYQTAKPRCRLLKEPAKALKKREVAAHQAGRVLAELTGVAAVRE